eukprot:894484-Prorocentrum_minimum.AAC.2
MLVSKSSCRALQALQTPRNCAFELWSAKRLKIIAPKFRGRSSQPYDGAGPASLITRRDFLACKSSARCLSLPTPTTHTEKSIPISSLHVPLHVDTITDYSWVVPLPKAPGEHQVFAVN